MYNTKEWIVFSKECFLIKNEAVVFLIEFVVFNEVMDHLRFLTRLTNLLSPISLFGKFSFVNKTICNSSQKAVISIFA